MIMEMEKYEFSSGLDENRPYCRALYDFKYFLIFLFKYYYDKKYSC